MTDQPDDEYNAYDDEVGEYWEADDEVCADCGRIINGEDLCGICGAAMCFACFEMGCGVCKGPHR